MGWYTYVYPLFRHGHFRKDTTTVTVRLLEAAASEASLVVASGTSFTTRRCTCSVVVLVGATEGCWNPEERCINDEKRQFAWTCWNMFDVCWRPYYRPWCNMLDLCWIIFNLPTSTVAHSRHIRRDEVHTHQKTVLLTSASPKGGSNSSKSLEFWTNIAFEKVSYALSCNPQA